MASIFMRFPEGKSKALTLSYDDGVEQDIRLIEIMKKNGLKGTFNLNSGEYAKENTVYKEGTIHRRMSRSEVTRVYSESGMEVAAHGYSHPFLEQLPVNLCTNEIVKDRESLEEQFKTIVRGFAYPFGTYNDQVVDCLRNAGIMYARTVISSHSFDMPSDWLRLEATCHHNDKALMELAHKFVEETPLRAPWLFYLWGHSYEFESKNNWNVIEEFASFVGNKEEIWYAGNIEICEYVHAYEQLIYSMNGKMIKNPTACELYFSIKDQIYSVKPGETLYITE